MAGSVKERSYPEIRFGGFSRDSGGAEFYLRVNALLEPDFVVLDYGAGRGAIISETASTYLRGLKSFKGKVAKVYGCDVDDAVFENPYIDEAALIDPAAPLPYPDASFDLVHASWVLEHVDDPDTVTREIIRVLKPGGYFCAVTPNRRGYIALASRLAGNARHVPILSKVQPDRKEFDVFPTRYRLNTTAALKRFFGPHGELAVYGHSSEPSYFFGKGWIHGAFRALHKFTPEPFHTSLHIFFRKKG